MTDNIRFNIINPQGIEAWAGDCKISQVVEIYINDKEFIDILRELEGPYAAEEGHPSLAGAYGHLTPKELIANLAGAGNKNEAYEDEGAELLCCSGCGFSGCWSIVVHIKQDSEYVYWYKFEHNHRNWEYNISYKFDRKEYEKALEEMKALSCN